MRLNAFCCMSLIKCYENDMPKSNVPFLGQVAIQTLLPNYKKMTLQFFFIWLIFSSMDLYDTAIPEESKFVLREHSIISKCIHSFFFNKKIYCRIITCLPSTCLFMFLTALMKHLLIWECTVTFKPFSISIVWNCL